MSTNHDIVPTGSIDAPFRDISGRQLNETALTEHELMQLTKLVDEIRKDGGISEEDMKQLAAACPRVLAMLVGIKGRAEEIRDRSAAQLASGAGIMGHYGGQNAITMRWNIARDILGEKT